MEATTPREFLEKVVPQRFKPEKAAGIDVVAQLVLTGTNGGNWTVIIKDQKLEITEGTHLSPSLKLTVAANDFMDMVNGKMGVEKAFFTGRIRFEGNLNVALKLRDAGFF